MGELEKQWRVLIHVTSAAFVDVEAKSEMEAKQLALDVVCEIDTASWENVDQQAVEVWDLSTEEE